MFFADAPSKPGKPGWPKGSVIGAPDMSFTAACPITIEQVDGRGAQTAGLTYFAPKRPG